MKPEDLPIETKLIQLAEEASELSQACLKLVRCRHGDTPVPEMDAKMHLLEEIADVLLCSKVLTSKADDRIVKGIMMQKAKRWEERLNGRSEDDS